MHINKLYSFSDRIYSIQLNKKQRSIRSKLVQVLGEQLHKQLEELLPTFDRITIFLNSPIDKATLTSLLKKIPEDIEKEKENEQVWLLPICFDSEFGNDLVHFFDFNKQAVLAYRSAFLKTQFKLEFYGFLPGFGYLSGLPKALHLPRKSSPDPRIKKGTLAVGGEQVGIYPQESPGGWQKIGHCPVPWINFSKHPYTFISPGEYVRFFEVDLSNHHIISKAVVNNQYQPICKPL